MDRLCRHVMGGVCWQMGGVCWWMLFLESLACEMKTTRNTIRIDLYHYGVMGGLRIEALNGENT